MGEIQDRVAAAVDDLTTSGREVGVQVAAYLHGEPIVDVAAGVAADAPIFSYSTGKGLTATVVHVLAERGALDYDLRIADVWPEYGRHGKDGTTLRHALTHAAGVPTLPPDITPADLCDWDRMCALVAAAEPVWPPGTRHGYHAWTFGWLVGETVRRATGRRVSEILATDVAAPLGVPGELFFGVPAADLHRLAPLVDRDYASVLAFMSAHVPHFDDVAPRGVWLDAALGNRPDILQADLPAVGTMTARAVARMFAALIGEVDGVRLISAERLREVTAVATSGPDWTFGQEAPTGLGYGVFAGGAFFGSSGNGGSLVYADPALGLSVACTKTLLSAADGDPMEDLWTLIRAAVGDRQAAA